MGGAGFEPAKAVPPDLQSGPFGRLGIHPARTGVRGTGLSPRRRDLGLGRGPGSPAAEGRAGGESRTHNRRFTKPVLCQLSYASDREAVKIPNIPSPASHARGLSAPAGKIRPSRSPE